LPVYALYRMIGPENAEAFAGIVGVHSYKQEEWYMHLAGYMAACILVLAPVGVFIKAMKSAPVISNV